MGLIRSITSRISQLWDVLISNPSNGDVLTYNATTQKWTNEQPQAVETGALIATNNLSDLNNDATARTNLGLGTAATHGATDFDASGSASTVQTNLTAHTSNTSNPHATTKSQIGLGLVQNEDTTNASNITSGVLSASRIPSLPYISNDNGNISTDGSSVLSADGYTFEIGSINLLSGNVLNVAGLNIEPNGTPAITTSGSIYCDNGYLNTDGNGNLYLISLDSNYGTWYVGADGQFVFDDGLFTSDGYGNITGSSFNVLNSNGDFWNADGISVSNINQDNEQDLSIFSNIYANNNLYVSSALSTDNLTVYNGASFQGGATTIGYGVASWSFVANGPGNAGYIFTDRSYSSEWILYANNQLAQFSFNGETSILTFDNSGNLNLGVAGQSGRINVGDSYISKATGSTFQFGSGINCSGLSSPSGGSGVIYLSSTGDTSIKFNNGELFSNAVSGGANHFMTGAPAGTFGLIGNNLALGDTYELALFANSGKIGIGTTTLSGSLTVAATIVTIPQSSAPSSPVEGMEYYDSASHTKKYWNGTTWIEY